MIANIGPPLEAMSAPAANGREDAQAINLQANH